MDKRHTQGITLLLSATLVVSGCGGLGKMKKYVENIKYTIDPNPLIVQGDSVALNINGNFPGKYFYKKAEVELTPTLTYAGGSTPYKAAFFQGEGAAGNHTVIPYETGKSFNYSDKVAYTPAMANSELMLMMVGRQGKKEMTFDPVKLADGVITTPYLMMSDDKVLLGKDKFQRVTSESVAATINYLVNSSVVRPGELTDADVKEMAAFIKGAMKRPEVNMKGLVVDAWASPEGELSLNENLASDRAKSASAWARGELLRNKVDAAKADGFYQLKPRGEDWEGFKKAMQASSIADRDLVLRVLEMYPDLAKREAEIRNMAATFVEIRDKILPALRRSEMKLAYDMVGKSDEQITALSKSNPESLNVEELLYSATLTTDMNEQLRIYRAAERLFPSDYRGANNVGYILMMQNKMAEAEAQFQKANSIQDNPVSTNNLGVVARLKGDRKKAADLYRKAMAAGDEVKYNLGIVNIQNGEYSAANTNMAGQSTFNAALAKLLGGDAAGAKSILEKAPEKDSAMGHYLMAVIGARMGNGDMVRNHVGLAVQKDGSLRDKALKDLEFRNYKGQLGI
jgi:Flp pilus assembly protein TadD